MPNSYNDILWQTLLGDNEVEICLQPTDTELPTDIYQPTNSTSTDRKPMLLTSNYDLV